MKLEDVLSELTDYCINTFNEKIIFVAVRNYSKTSFPVYKKFELTVVCVRNNVRSELFTVVKQERVTTDGSISEQEQKNRIWDDIDISVLQRLFEMLYKHELVK